MHTTRSFPLQIIQSPNRKSIGITVYPNCSVIIRTPKNTPQSKVDEILLSKQIWITQKIEHFQKNPPQKITPKQYIEGEDFYYLGQQYKLKVIAAKQNKIEIIEDQIVVHKSPRSSTKTIIIKWLFEQAQNMFLEKTKINFEIFSKFHKYHFPTLKLRQMKSRWGSMSNRGDMTLNIRLIHTPPFCIDYVIMHELCHLKHHNHSRKFYQLQLQLNPNWKHEKAILETFSTEIRRL